MPKANPEDRKIGQKVDHLLKAASASGTDIGAVKTLRKKRNRLIEIKNTRDALAHSIIFVGHGGSFPDVSVAPRSAKDKAKPAEFSAEDLNKMSRDLREIGWLISDIGRDISRYFVTRPKLSKPT